MVIESPGIDEIIREINEDTSNILIVKHSNRHKNATNFSGMTHVNGSDIGLEKTISNFIGTLFVGESMVIVYALLCGKHGLKVIIMLPRNAFDNLQCLQSLFDDPSRDGLSLRIR